ncbi:MAG: DUF308 domain-containing protein [Caulobacteraceae bacterium]
MFTARSSLHTAEAVLLIVLGLAALVLPVAAGLAAAVVFGVILVLSGVLGLVAAFASGGRHPRSWSLVSAVIALLVGLLLLFHPFAGAVGLTLLLGVYLLVDGMALVGMALSHRRRVSGRWAWLMASGILDLVLALIIIFLNAVGSAVLIGFIVGIDLIAAGIALLMFQRAVPTVSSSSALL